MAKVRFTTITEAKKCELLLYRNLEETPESVFLMDKEDSMGNLRCLSVNLEEPEQYVYHYRLDGKVVLDPYAKSIETRAFGVVSQVVQPSFDWEKDQFPKLNYTETIAYSLHVRGFTMHPTSQVENRGTFGGVVEKIPYLKELGVNQLHLMPI